LEFRRVLFRAATLRRLRRLEGGTRRGHARFPARHVIATLARLVLASTWSRNGDNWALKGFARSEGSLTAFKREHNGTSLHQGRTRKHAAGHETTGESMQRACNSGSR